MGIVADLGRSSITFKDPKWLDRATTISRINNDLAYDMQAFTIEFGILFDPDPQKGVGASPKDAQSWRIGLVQNVLYERLYFEYDDKSTFQMELTTPSVDIVPATNEFPFYATPKPGAPGTRPVADITYTAQGYGETSARKFDNKPDMLSLWDQPGGGAFFRKNGAMINRVEKTLAFQTWLVAIKTGEFSTSSAFVDKMRDAFIPKLVRTAGTSVAVLAHIPPFSLMFWFELKSKGFKPKRMLDTPPFDWGVYGQNGHFPAKRINRSIQGLGPTPDIKPALGDGKRFPATKGPPANEIAHNWLAANGLRL
jgi:hypothetical protein